MKWSSKSLGSRFQHQFFYYLGKYAGKKPAQLFLRLVVGYYALLPKVRQRALPYIQRRFPTAGRWMRCVHTYRLYLAFGTILLDRTLAKATGHFPLHRNPQLQAAIQKARATGHGCIVLTAHVGAWQLGMAGMDDIPCPVHILQYRLPDDVDSHYFEHGLGRPMHIINSNSPFGGLLEAAAALKRNELVCIMGDRALSAEDICTVPFLGEPVSFPITAFALASITHAPIVISFTMYNNGVTQGTLAGIVDVPSGLSRKNPNAFSPYISAFSSYLEQQTLQYPYQFFNFYNMWKDTP